MAKNTIRVSGYKETARAFYRVNRDARAALYAGMKAAAEPIAEDARQRLAKYQPIQLSTIRPRANQSGVFITQSAKKRTGRRPDFGSLQMRKGLLPAAYGREDDIDAKVEEAFIGLTTAEGF